MQNSCPVCAGKSLAVLHTVKDHFLSNESFEIWQCADCRFSFTLNPPGEEEIGKYYKSEDYISHSDTKKGFVNRIYHFARKWMLRRKYKLVRHTSNVKEGTILDIGCGTGYFAAYMQERGWKTTGIEADQDAKKFAETRYGLEIQNLESISNMDSSSYDSVTLWHVLEHLKSPRDVLKEVSRILKVKGTCIIALPNTDSLDSGYYKEFWAAWDVPRHLWHFNNSSIATLIKDCGLKLSQVRRMPLDAFYISILSEKYKKSGMAVIRGLIFGKIAWILSLFKRSKSSSLIYVLTRES